MDVVEQKFDSSVKRVVGVSNSFSLQMLERKEADRFEPFMPFARLTTDDGVVVSCVPIDAKVARWILAQPQAEGWESYIGHPDVAHVVQADLGLENELYDRQRRSCKLTGGDALVVAQYTGPRLPEGATALPEGATILYWFVQVVSSHDMWLFTTWP